MNIFKIFKKFLYEEFLRYRILILVLCMHYVRPTEMEKLDSNPILIQGISQHGNQTQPTDTTN